MPPLRDREEDIGPLVDWFVNMYRKGHGYEQIRVSPKLLTLFREYEWPGNVRELQHTIEHALVMMEGHTLEVRHLPAYMQNWSKETNVKKEPRPIESNTSIRQSVRNLERNMILDALEKTHYNRSKAIQLLGISRRTLYKKLRDMAIEF